MSAENDRLALCTSGTVAEAISARVTVFADGESCRRELARNRAVERVIVDAQVRDVEPINLVAALRKDSSERVIYLVGLDPTPSLLSRAYAAGVDEVITPAQVRIMATGGQTLLDDGLPRMGWDTEKMSSWADIRSSSAGSIAEYVGAEVESEGFPYGDKTAAGEPPAAAGFPSLVPEKAASGTRTSSDAGDELLQKPVGFQERLACDETLSAPEEPSDARGEQVSNPSDSPSGSDGRVPDSQASSCADGRLGQKTDPVGGAMCAGDADEASAADDRCGLVLSFLSGSGGTGKSTLSLLMALLLQRIGFRVALVDLDLQFGDIRFIAEGEPLITKDDMPFLQANELTIDRFLDESGLCFISPPEEPELAEEVVELVPEVVGLAARRADFVVVNTGSFWNDLHAMVLEQSDLVCFVMDQRATSINNCKRCVELCTRLEIPYSKLRYVLNRCSYHAPFTTFDCSLMLGGPSVYGVDSGGSLVDELLEVGAPHELIEARNMMVCSMAEMIDRMLEEFGIGGAPRESLKPLLRRKYITSLKKKRKEVAADAVGKDPVERSRR